MSSIFGGSKSKQSSTSHSENQAYGTIADWAAPLLGYSGQGAQGMAALLGGDSSGFDKYKAATGYDYTAEQGSRGITGNAAASGLLRSGSTGKALQRFAAGLDDQYVSNYMNQLQGLSGQGNTAAGTLAGAGQVSDSESSGKSSTKKGIGKFLGAAAGAVAMSDRRLKRDIKKIGVTAEGLNLYEYYYKANPFIKKVGVMADEVALLKPEALGPVVNGYMSVDYSKLEA